MHLVRPQLSARYLLAAAVVLTGATVATAPLLSDKEATRATAYVARALPKQPLTKKKTLRRPVTPKSVLPNDPLWRDSWSLAKANAPAAWTVTTGSAQIVVAVLDTGIDGTHPDLQGAIVEGYDVVNRDSDPSDDHGHGTMVAGIIAARSNNGIGGVGACWNCSLMPVKVIGADGSGSAADIAEGITWAADHGAQVVNLSFTMSGPDDGVARAIEYAQARGAVVVAAAGNSGGTDVTFPAGLPGVVSVTGTDASDSRYGWATYGGWVQLAAPGCSQSTAKGGGYGEFCGTSSAAAFVSGVTALARSSATGASAAAVAAALSSKAVRVGGIVATGRVDAAAALAALRS